MATRAQIRNRAANDLGILRLGQSLQAQDDARVLSGYDEVYARLKRLGLATWAMAGEVPDELVPHVVALVADNCLNTYSVSPERFQRIKLASGDAIGAIRVLADDDYASQDEPTDY